MSGLSPVDRQARRQRKRRDELVRYTVRAAVVLIIFGLGIAIGQALHDNPSPAGSVTLERTIRLPSVPPGSTVAP